MFIDSHVHTKNFSADAKMTIDDLLEFNGISNNISFCITEHYDYDHGDNVSKEQLLLDIYDYCFSFNSIKNSYESENDIPFPILCGIEYGYLKHLNDFYENLSSLRKFDYIVGSVHWIDDFDPYFDQSIYNRGKKSVYSSYLDLIAKMLKDCDAFDAVGHFDYLIRYAPYEDKMLRYRDFPDYFDEIFSLCITKGKAFELNTKSCFVLGKRLGEKIIFDPDIIKRYKELGGELITLGSDAHRKEDINVLFEETRHLLLQNGFKYISYFKNRKAEFKKI